MAQAKRSWREKLADAKAKPGLPKVFDCEKSGQRFVVPSPAEVEKIIRRVRRGSLILMPQIAEKIRAAHDVDIACPMTTGIFAWIIAHASEEEGGPRRTPWWRVLTAKGELNPKYPGGGDAQRELLQSEGHRVVAKGKHLRVAGLEAPPRRKATTGSE